MEGLLIKFVVGVIVFGVLFAIVRLILPNLGLPAWVGQVVLLVLGAVFVIWLLYLLVPLIHMAA